MSTVTLEQALTITRGAFQHALEVAAAPLTVVVLDNAGRLVSLQRQDGSSLLRPDIAIGKAWGAIALGRSSRGLAEMTAARPAFMAAVNVLAQGNILPVPGGVLIRDAQQHILGSVGVTGDLSDVDEACAVAGISLAELAADCS
ncbi:GlcG/HbpS family heme-binding protein [Oceanisphaera psychrotolerans]|uniref:GlcG protein n=1 Tax=Oceanisphaera psychrotolerans TaxID=1414654 RepID=A0A1J4QCA9_9GAMM|nr:heme-binding protein [Oceanisphaera psychrotolerans]OIN03814.1 GlcG protein [Oceanisphaera psychrotolerans]